MVKAYFVIDRLWTLMINGLTAVYQGFWLGVLSHSDLREVTARHYGKSNTYHSDAHNLQGLFEWELLVILRFFRDCRSILLGAAGGGREVIALSEQGKEVSAFECQPSLVEAAKLLLQSRNIQAEIALAAPDRVPDTFGLYDGLILGWGAYIHIAGRDARIEFLKQFRSHTRPGGPLLISFYVRKEISRKMRWTFRIASAIRRIRRAKETINLGDVLDGRFDHYFTEDEIRSELEAAGFELIYYAAEPFGHAVGRAV